MDTNPPDDDSKWYEYFEEIKPENAEMFKQPSGLSQIAENMPHLPTGYYTNMAIGKDPGFVKVYIDGDYGYVKEGRPVYPEYNDGTHCSEEAIFTEGLPIYRGWDFGLTPCCIFTQQKADGQWVLFDELDSESMGIDRFSDEVLAYSKKWPDSEFIDIGDPAGEQRAATDERTCFDIMQVLESR
jgi:hypothetical protein